MSTAHTAPATNDVPTTITIDGGASARRRAADLAASSRRQRAKMRTEPDAYVTLVASSDTHPHRAMARAEAKRRGIA